MSALETHRQSGGGPPILSGAGLYAPAPVPWLASGARPIFPMTEPGDLLSDLIARAKRAGADAADALTVNGVSLSIAWRLGQLEKLEREEGQDLGLRVLIGRRQAVASTTDFSKEGL